MRSFLLLASSAAALAACSPFDPDLGAAPYLCAAEEPRCPEGYTCDESGTNPTCVGGSGLPVDAPVSGFQCQDDSPLETANGTNNDSISSAFVTPVQPGMRKDFSLAALAICPEGDRDTYMVVTSANQNLEAITEWESGSPVSVSILGSGGATLNNGTSNGATSMRAYVANLPAGTYYVQAFAAATVKNNYKIRFAVTP